MKRPTTAGTPLADLAHIKAEARNKTDPIFVLLAEQARQKRYIGTLTLYLYRDRYRLMKRVQFWTVRFHETSLLILSLLIILDYFITD